jgi:hypothetical protein
MSLRAKLAKILEPSTLSPEEQAVCDKRNEVGKSTLMSKRFILVVSFGVLVVLNMLPPSLFHDISLVAIFYVLGETASTSIVATINGWVKVTEVKADVEYEKIASTERMHGADKAEKKVA